MKNMKLYSVLTLAVCCGIVAVPLLNKADVEAVAVIQPTIEPPKVEIAETPEALPTCTQPDIKARIQYVSRQANPQIEVLELYPNYEIFFDEKNNIRECLAGITTNLGEAGQPPLLSP